MTFNDFVSYLSLIVGIAALLFLSQSSQVSGPAGPQGPAGPEGPQGEPGDSTLVLQSASLILMSDQEIVSVRTGVSGEQFVVDSTFQLLDGEGPSGEWYQTGELYTHSNGTSIGVLGSMPVPSGTLTINPEVPFSINYDSALPWQDGINFDISSLPDAPYTGTLYIADMNVVDRPEPQGYRYVAIFAAVNGVMPNVQRIDSNWAYIGEASITRVGEPRIILDSLVPTWRSIIEQMILNGYSYDCIVMRFRNANHGFLSFTDSVTGLTEDQVVMLDTVVPIGVSEVLSLAYSGP